MLWGFSGKRPKAGKRGDMPKKLSVGSLSDKQRRKLAELQRTARSVDEFCRSRAVALHYAGWRVVEIADAFGVVPGTIYGWLGRFRSNGADGLRDRPKKGRPPIYDRTFRKEACSAVSKRPWKLGMAFTVWSVLTLAAALFQWKKKKISPTHLRRILHEEGYVWRRPKLSLRRRQNRKLYKAVRRRLRALEREAMEPGSRIALIYADESEFHLNPGLVGAWRRRGEQMEVPSAGQNRKAATFGGVDFATGEMTWHLTDCKNQHEFLKFLERLVKAHPGRRIVLVLDNVAYHKTKAVLNFVEGQGERLEIVWLPPYSPNLNRIERVWKHLKQKYVYNEFFGDKEGLVRSVQWALEALNADLRLSRKLLMKAHGKAA